MILDDATEIKSLYGKKTEHQGTIDEIADYLSRDQQDKMTISEVQKYRKIRDFGDQLPRNTSVFLTH